MEPTVPDQTMNNHPYFLQNRAKNPEVVERVQRGQILSQPGNCPVKVYEVRPRARSIL